MEHMEILEYLYGLESRKIKLGLKNIQNLLRKIGNPEKELKCIHVAGTNGKGSVCAMLFHILKEAGYKAGLYTSPHLKRFNERIRINEHFITNREIADYYLKIKPHITSQSFFEITTAMAFLYFKDKNADFVVLEAGLGGRLDATNVIAPLVSVVTNVGLDHTEILGKKIESIAFEKAGIIKNSVPVVAGAKGKALKVIEKIAKQRNAPAYPVRKFKNVEFDYLSGSFQQQNKDAALTAIDILKKFYPIKINEKQTANGIKKTQWGGRFQFISKNVLIDCAHNPSGFEALKKELKIIKHQKKIENLIFMIGIQNTKDAASMLKAISPLASTIIFTKSKNKKASQPEELLSVFKKISKGRQIQARIIPNTRKALNYAKKTASKNDLVVAAGSIYMIGEII